MEYETIENNFGSILVSDKCADTIVMQEIYDLFNVKDLSLELIINLPEHGNIITREMPEGLTDFVRKTMVEYPE